MSQEIKSGISSICQVKLPIGETLNIKRNRLSPSEEARNSKKRIGIATGIHGDELEGQYVCYEVIRRIKEHPECLTGIVDVYPAMNPMGIDSITRGIPGFDLDMNRIFPGSRDGAMTEYVAYKIMEELSGADLIVDIHASNIYLTEIPQIRINELRMKTGFEDIGTAKKFAFPYVITHSARPFDTTTLNYNWQIWETRAFSIYTTDTDEIDRRSAADAVKGIEHMLNSEEILHSRISGGYHYHSQVLCDDDLVSVRCSGNL